jgi:hypothetical protein
LGNGYVNISIPILDDYYLTIPQILTISIYVELEALKREKVPIGERECRYLGTPDYPGIVALEASKGAIDRP